MMTLEEYCCHFDPHWVVGDDFMGVLVLMVGDDMGDDDDGLLVGAAVLVMVLVVGATTCERVDGIVDGSDVGAVRGTMASERGGLVVYHRRMSS